MRIQFDQVRSVQLTDGWHTVVRGTFTTGPVQLVPTAGSASSTEAVTVGWPDAFTFETPDGAVFSGPLSSLRAVSHQATEKPRPPAHDDLARRLHGQVINVNDITTVRFTHADHDFDLWLGPTGTWRYAQATERDTVGSTTDTYLPEDDVYLLVNHVMADLKQTWGLGRPPAPRDGYDHAAPATS